MVFKPNITFKEAVFVFATIAAGVGVYYTMEGRITATAQNAVQAQKLSAENTRGISNLSKIVSDLTKAVAVQNETVKWQYKIQQGQMGYLKERMGSYERRPVASP